MAEKELAEAGAGKSAQVVQPRKEGRSCEGKPCEEPEDHIAGLRREDQSPVTAWNAESCSFAGRYLACTEGEAAEAVWLLQSISPRWEGREQLLFLASRTGYALFLVSANTKCVSSPGSKEWKLGMCSLLYCTNYVINKACAKYIKNSLPSQKWLFKKKPGCLFRAYNNFC